MTARRLRIASIAYWNAFTSDGVTRKLTGQISAWSKLDVEPRLFVLSPPPVEGAPARVDAEIHTFGGPWARIPALRGLVRAVREFAPDVVYVRYDRFVPPLSRQRVGAPLVVELNTRAAAELADRPFPVRGYNRLCHHVTVGSASGIVAVSHEILGDVTADRPLLRTVVIPNGVDPAEIPSLPAPSNPEPRLCFLGSPGQRWHGLDKLLALARARPSWTVDIVGVTAAQLGTAAPANVIAHGRLERPEYLAVMARADAAVGTLALHRKAMNEASPLKVLEYLQAGIPTIIGYEDSNFVGLDPWYLLKLPNGETNVVDSADRIDTWVESVRGRRVPRVEAEARTGAFAKESARVAFLREVCGGSVVGD